ncbi:hypothetical protein YYC_00246, partial [Plasmodium yoelii 17X]
CGKFDFLRMYLPDELGDTATLNFDEYENFMQYCPEKDSGKNECNNNLDKITAVFLWLLEQCYSALKNQTHNENSVNTFFIYIISWFSYKLNQNKGHNATTINDFYNKNVKDSGKYTKFVKEAYTIGDIKGFMDERTDLLNINIEDLSKFYDASKILCSMYINAEKHTKNSTVPNAAKDFVIKYKDLNEGYNIGDTARSKILPFLLTDYNNLINKCKSFTSLPEITTEFSAQMSGVTSSSPIGNKLFTVLSIFGAIAFFLGISYKVNNKELKNYVHYIYAKVNKKIIRLPFLY